MRLVYQDRAGRRHQIDGVSALVLCDDLNPILAAQAISPETTEIGLPSTSPLRAEPASFQRILTSLGMQASSPQYRDLSEGR